MPHWIADCQNLSEANVPKPICQLGILPTRHHPSPLVTTARALVCALRTNGQSDAQYVLAWIRRHQKLEFTKSEAQHHGKRRFPKADDIDQALGELVKRGYIRLQPMEQKGPGRPPSPKFDVNPLAFDEPRRSRNSPISADTFTISDSGNNGSALEGQADANREQVIL